MKRPHAYALTLFGYFSLLFLWLLWPTVISPPSRIPVAIILLVTVVPLLFPLRGLLHGVHKSFIWMAYLSLFYFTHGVTESASGSSQTILAVLEITISVILFFGITRYLKAG